MEPHGDADEEELTTIKEKLEKHLSMQAGIPVNLETPDAKKKANHTTQVANVTATTEENEDDESSTDSEAQGDQ